MASRTPKAHAGEGLPILPMLRSTSIKRERRVRARAGFDGNVLL